MLSLETATDYGSIYVDCGATVDTYTFTGTDAYSCIRDFVAWCNDTFTGSWSWTWSRDTLTGGALLALHHSGGSTAEVTPDAAAQAALGFPDFWDEFNDGHDFAGVSAAVGTWCPTARIAVSKHARLLGSGDAGGSRSVRPGVPGIAGQNPTIDAIGTALDAARLTAVLALATTPRRCFLYQTHTGLWRGLALGAASRSAGDDLLYRFSLETAGEAI